MLELLKQKLILNVMKILKQSVTKLSGKPWGENTLTGPPTRFWECHGQKSFRYLEEWHKSKFPGKHP